ncbi:MAG: hypothetical protein QGG09_21485, partial [Pirellulaceae bacterium]|nr:hypothetical protein [Pirellulaceae bacterium]
MPKAEQLSVVFAAVCLGRRFPIIGITEADIAERYSELIELAVIAPKAIWPSSAAAHRLTDFGTEVRRCSLDFSIGILEAFCARFDLSWHGRIAAAYIAAQWDIYVRHNIGSATVGLYPEQLDQAVVVPAADDVRTSRNAAGDDADDNADGEADPLCADTHLGKAHAAPSDLHTAVKVYLQYIVAGNVDEKVFNLNCSAQMHYHLEKARERYVTNGCHQLTAATAQSLLQAPAWNNVLSLAAVWAFQDRIALRYHSDNYQTSMPNT